MSRERRYSPGLRERAPSTHRPRGRMSRCAGPERTPRRLVVAARPARVDVQAASGARCSRAAMTWMQRLRREFGIDLSHCPRCGAALEWSR